MNESTLRTWDPAEHLESREDVLAYLDAAFEDGNPKVIAAALGDVARAKLMTELPPPLSPLFGE